MPSKSSASDPERGPDADGEGERPCWLSVGGRWEIQSCTRSETRVFDSKLSVFRDEEGVVIMMIGEDEYGVFGR